MSQDQQIDVDFGIKIRAEFLNEYLAQLFLLDLERAIKGCVDGWGGTVEMQPVVRRRREDVPEQPPG